MLSAVGTALTSCIGWLGTILDAITDTDGDLAAILPVIGLSIALGIVGWAIAKIKSLTWGF